MADRNFGKMLAWARKHKGWTQSQLSKKAGYKQSSMLSRIEKSESQPRSETIDMLIRALGYASLEELTSEYDTTNANSAIPTHEFLKGHHSPLSTDAEIQQRNKAQIDALTQNHIRQVVAIISDLPPGSKWYYATCREPIEFDFLAHDFQSALVNAVKRGVQFCYIFPNKDYYKNNHLEAQKYRRIFAESKHLEETYRSFTEVVLKNEFGLNDDLIAKSFRMLTTENAVIVDPLREITYYVCETEGSTIETVMSNVKVGSWDQSDVKSFWYPFDRTDGLFVSSLIKDLEKSF